MSAQQTIHILHITPWYPSEGDGTRGIFIKRHVQSIAPFAKQHVLHMAWEEDVDALTDDDGFTSVKVKYRWQNWRWREWNFYRALRQQLILMNARETFSHVNFHIAYPSLVYLNRLRKYLPEKVCVTEHWSIYHFNFYNEKSNDRIAKVFMQNVPLLSVSDELGRSIQAFTKNKIAYHVLPNVVAEEFKHQQQSRGGHFLMAAYWKSPKNPLPLLYAVYQLRQKGERIRIRIAGQGPLIMEMKQFVQQKQLDREVEFLGVLNAVQLAVEMNSAHAFVMPTDYETFSVGCAEALCCGCPVLADDIGALPELINSENGILRLSTQPWEDALMRMARSQFDYKEIAAKAMARYSVQVVGMRYFQFIQSLA